MPKGVERGTPKLSPELAECCSVIRGIMMDIWGAPDGEHFPELFLKRIQDAVDAAEHFERMDFGTSMKSIDDALFRIHEAGALARRAVNQ